MRLRFFTNGLPFYYLIFYSNGGKERAFFWGTLFPSPFAIIECTINSNSVYKSLYLEKKTLGFGFKVNETLVIMRCGYNEIAYIYYRKPFLLDRYFVELM